MGGFGLLQTAVVTLLVLHLPLVSLRWSVDHLCKDSADKEECERRVGVCRSLHQVSGHRAQFIEALNECASQLSITLPESSTSSPSSPKGLPEELKQWLNNNLQDKHRLFKCARARYPSKFLNDDGTVNRERIISKINEMFANLDEEELQFELETRAETCEDTSDRRVFFRCVYMGCATP